MTVVGVPALNEVPDCGEQDMDTDWSILSVAVGAGHDTWLEGENWLAGQKIAGFS